MNDIRLTIGMATHRDFDGVYFSLNSIRLYHTEVLQFCELIVVDNDPTGPQAGRLREFLAQVEHGAFSRDRPQPLSRNLPQPYSVRYIPYSGATGTTAPRDMIFHEASGDAVLVIDSHVQIWPCGIQRLHRYFASNPESGDLLHGPLVMDSLSGVATHFDDVWRGGMWGTWGTAWQHPNGGFVSPREDAYHKVSLYSLLSNELLETLPISWAGHETHLRSLGYRLASDSDEPFPIPAQGLGLFACRRDAWLKFHPHFREFGGEEWYVHEKYRQAGRQVLCLPWLQWIHRFGDPAAGRHYPRSTPAKVRNYVLGLRDLNLPLDRVKRHFVDNLSEDPVQPGAGGGPMDLALWEAIIADPEAYPVLTAAEQVATEERNESPTLDELFEHARNTPSNINSHCDKLRELSSRCSTVVEFSHRPEASTVALLAGQPERLTTYSAAPPTCLSTLAKVRGRTTFEFQLGDSLSSSIPSCDLLFIDTDHNAVRLWAEFERHIPCVTRYIVLHGTSTFGVRGDDGNEGLMIAVRRLVTESLEWAIAYHTGRNNGLTVLSRLRSDIPTPAPRLWPLDRGPGTELKKLLAHLGVTPNSNCDCNAKAARMDAWGAAGCRKNLAVIVDWLREGQARWGWRDKLAAGGKAVFSGLAFQLNPLDPIPGLVEQAISQAEDRESQLSKSATPSNTL